MVMPALAKTAPASTFRVEPSTMSAAAFAAPTGIIR